MVIVEFFSQSPIDNMISALVNTPETVVFVGESKAMKRYDPIFRRFLDAVGNSTTKLEYRGARVHELHEIVKTLEQIVEDYPDCHFDITGGEPMVMAAVGIIYERFRSRGIELHQYNIRTGKVYDCDLNGNVVSGDIPVLTVEQNIILHGGSIVPAGQRECGTYTWDFNLEFRQDIRNMWEICRGNCSIWNRQITMISDMLQFNELPGDPLRIRASIEKTRSYLTARNVPMDLNCVFDRLERLGLLKLEQADDFVCVTFKNEQVRRVLTKAGTVLELVTYLAARDAALKKGKPCYHDVMCGVFVDWDGVVHELTEEEVDTENEIDLILMHGAVPVFVSCKNGSVDEEELYKLNAVADRFGGAYAKKALVGTTLGKNIRSKQYLLERAADMGIQVIEGVHEMSEEELMKQLRLLV